MLHDRISRRATLALAAFVVFGSPNLAIAENASAASNRVIRKTLVERSYQNALNEMTSMEFIETPLIDVVEYLEDCHQIQIEIDSLALDEVGLGSDTPITCDIRGVSLRAALRLILKQLELTYIIQDEVLQVTTPERLEPSVLTKVYKVADLVESEEQESRLLDALDAGLGGRANSSVIFRGLLVARMDFDGHEDLRELLATMRLALNLNPPDDDPLASLPVGSHVDLSFLRLSSRDVAFLAGHKHIASLNLQGTRIDDTALAHLRDLTELRSLNLNGTQISDRALEQLKKLPKLETLSLLDTHITAEGLSALAMFTDLKVLRVGGKVNSSSLTEKDIQTLKTSLPDCQIFPGRLYTKPVDRGPDPFGGIDDPFGK